ncbi:MAG: AsmA family protein [Pseudomonadota bacterium]|nr:AsmA family protein [Pseudomonadota bacterium]
MKTALKWIYRIIIAAVLLIFAIAIYLFIAFDLNELKGKISETVNEKTGLHLHLNGDIEWQVYPVIGLRLKEASLKDEQDSQELLGVGTMALGVEFLPLFSKQVNLKSIILNELNVDYQKNADGSSNFDPLLNLAKKQPEEAEQTPEENKEGQPLTMSFQDFLITDSQILFSDKDKGSSMNLTINKLLAQNFSLTRPFELQFDGAYADQKGMTAKLKAHQNVQLDTQNKQHLLSDLVWQVMLEGKTPDPVNATINIRQIGVNQADNNLVATLEGIDVNTTLTGIGTKVLPIDFKTSSLVFNKNQDRVSLASGSSLTVDQMQSSFQLAVSQATKNPTLNGSIQLAPMNLKAFMDNFAQQPIRTADSEALTHFKGEFALAGTPKAIQIQNINATLDQTQLTGSATFKASTKAIGFNLSADQFNADRYLPPSKSGEVKGETLPAEKKAGEIFSKKAVLPVAALRKLNLDGAVQVGQLTLKKEALNDVRCGINANSGLIKMSDCRLQVLGGTVVNNITVDARSNTPVISVRNKVNQLSLPDMLEAIIHKKPITGLLSSSTNLTLTGDSIYSWMDQLNGDLQINLTDALLKDVNLRKLIVNQVGEELTMLIEYGLAQKGYAIPQNLVESTEFKNLSFPATVKDGIMQIDRLSAKLNATDSLSGSGSFDIANLTFDYNLDVKAPSLFKGELAKLADVSWPIQCKGNVLQATSSWCSVNQEKTGAIIQQIAKSAAQERLTNALNDKLGLGLDADKDLQQAAKDEVQKHTQEQVDKAKQEIEDRVKDKVGEELGNKVKDLFNF